MTTSLTRSLCAVVWFCVLAAVCAKDKTAECDVRVSGRTGSIIGTSAASVTWTAGPVSPGGFSIFPPACVMQGVLAIKPPAGATRVYVGMQFENPNRFSFHLTDSPTSYGFGDSPPWHEMYSELHNYGNSISFFSYVHQLVYPRAFHKKVGVYISRRRLTVAADSGKLISLYGAGLLRFDKLFLGVNRVVHVYNGKPYLGRSGSGMCSVCVRFGYGLPGLTDAVPIK